MSSQGEEIMNFLYFSCNLSSCVIKSCLRCEKKVSEWF